MKHRNHHGKNRGRAKSEDEPDPTDTGSLTYSAASSINSAGESTDSSFADIMRVLDMQDGGHNSSNTDFANMLHKSKHSTSQEYQYHMSAGVGGGVGGSHYPQGHPKSSSRSSATSVASSLQYSTDSQSHMLVGADIISTITGQASDSYAYDGGNLGALNATALMDVPASAKSEKNGVEHGGSFGDGQNIMFAPAEPTESLKRRKQMKRNKIHNRDSSSSTKTPKSKNTYHHNNNTKISPSSSSSSFLGSNGSSGERKSKRRSSLSSSKSNKEGKHRVTTTTSSYQARSNTSTPKSNKINDGGSGRASTPPIHPICPHQPTDCGQDDLCYSQWWMSCFPDAFKNLMPKR